MQDNNWWLVAMSLSYDGSLTITYLHMIPMLTAVNKQETERRQSSESEGAVSKGLLFAKCARYLNWQAYNVN